MILTYQFGKLLPGYLPTDILNDDLGSHRMGEAALACIDADFEFWIDSRCVLKQPYWNVVQLAMQLAYWAAKGMKFDFRFSCIDADEEELFTFRQLGPGFSFYSEWEEEPTPALIPQAALREFIDRLRIDVRARIKHELGFEVGGQLGS
jgi:hypothetical protein